MVKIKGDALEEKSLGRLGREKMNQHENRASKWPTLIATTISYFLTPLALSSVSVALPSMGREFSANALTLSWVATTYLLTSAIFLVPIGKLSDIYGRKKIFIFGNFLFAVSSFLIALSPNAETVILLRALQGIACAMVYGTGLAILTSVYPPDDRGKALGINVAAVYLGLSFGPFIGGVFTQHFGWRSTFFLNVPFGIFIVVYCLWKLKGEWAEAKGETFDYTGAFIYSITVLSIVFGSSLLPERSSIIPIAIGIVGVIAFVNWETRVKNPLIDIRLFKTNRAFTLSNMSAFINYGATFAIGFLLSFYLQHIKGFSPQNAGLVMVSQPVVEALLSPAAGRISDRVEPRIVASVGMALTAAGVFLLALLKENTSTVFILTSLVILGSGIAIFSSPNANAIMGSVEKRYYGVAASLVSTMRLFGQMFSMGIAMLIFALYIGRVEISPAYYPHLLRSVKAAFTIFGILCVGGTFASLTRGNIRGA